MRCFGVCSYNANEEEGGDVALSSLQPRDTDDAAASLAARVVGLTLEVRRHGRPRGRTFPEPEGGFREPKAGLPLPCRPSNPGDIFDPPAGSSAGPPLRLLSFAGALRSNPGTIWGRPRGLSWLPSPGGRVFFNNKPLTYATETSRIAYLIACLRGG
ncbi:unnamed protein product [Boreogadus saida]